MSLTQQEQEILDSIVVPSESNPSLPEFPPANPKWPSTPVYQIKVPGFSNVWLKDESVNPTGTHKDRMAWEMVVTYRALLQSKRDGAIDKIPQMSIISSGSAALAIQTMLAQYNLPPLKVLVDFHINKQVREKLESIGCEIFETDLSKSMLSTEDILYLTNNEDGIDITSDDSLGPFDVFYDWLSYDVVNQNADYVFVPYGTGHLYENIVNVARRTSASAVTQDKRYLGDTKQLRHMHFIGATTNKPDTAADKLYSPHLPFVHFGLRWIELAKRKGYIGKESNVHIVQEQFLQQAMNVAEENGVIAEASGIAGLALLLQMQKQIPSDAKILIVNTGKSKFD